jgi:hypothetical protein
MAAPAAPAPAPAKTDGGQQAVVMANAFTKAARKKTETISDKSGNLSYTSTVRLDQIEVPATGYLRHLWLLVELATTAGTLAADGPWNVLSSVVFTDVNGQALVELSGYQLFVANLFGGLTQHADPRYHPSYSVASGAPTFALRVPIEIIQRNALGSLPNLNSAQAYKLKIVLAAVPDVYSVLPTGSVAVAYRVRVVAESWGNPPQSDIRGVPNVTTPPALGTTRNLTTEVKAVANGANTLRFSRVGNVIRNHFLITRDSGGVRNASIMPLEVSLLLDGNQIHRSPLTYLVQRMCELYGILPADVPTGVYAMPYTDDFDGTPGEEAGDYWLTTTGATRLETQGTFRAAGSLEIVTDDILAFSSPGGAGATLGAQS